jgi:hypothetical protein
VEAPPSESTAAKQTSTALVRDQAYASIIARGTIAPIAAEQASAFIFAIAAGVTMGSPGVVELE